MKKSTRDTTGTRVDQARKADQLKNDRTSAINTLIDNLLLMSFQPYGLQEIAGELVDAIIERATEVENKAGAIEKIKAALIAAGDVETLAADATVFDPTPAEFTAFNNADLIIMLRDKCLSEHGAYNAARLLQHRVGAQAAAIEQVQGALTFMNGSIGRFDEMLQGFDKK